MIDSTTKASFKLADTCHEKLKAAALTHDYRAIRKVIRVYLAALVFHDDPEGLHGVHEGNRVTQDMG